ASNSGATSLNSVISKDTSSKATDARQKRPRTPSRAALQTPYSLRDTHEGRLRTLRADPLPLPMEAVA
ncbi:MAG: hypothetical protein AVDCRST_MAG67-1572, partial [uncultured Solirubrobacteraceae bacterium]